MGLRSFLSDVVNSITHSRRKVWHGAQRSYFGLREMEQDEISQFQASVDQHLPEVAGVAWASIHSFFGVLVVAHDEQVSIESVEREIDYVEFILGLNRHPFQKNRRFPADNDFFFHTILEMAADIGGVTAGLAMRFSPASHRTLWWDVSALTTALDNVPLLREPLEQQIGAENAELLINLATNFGEAFTSGWSGSLIDLMHRYHDLKVQKARAASWQAWESMLMADPAHHRTPDQPPQTRPTPLPDGPVEHYSKSAVQMMLGGFGFGVAATHSLEQAAASIYSGVPKPARLGALSFTRELTMLLARQGFLVLNADTLTLLDRITAVVIDFELVSAEYGVITEIQLLAEVDRNTIQAYIDQLFDYSRPFKTQHTPELRLSPLTFSQLSESNAVPVHEDLIHDKHFFLLGLWRKDRLIALIYVQRVPDHAAQLIMNRIHRLGLNLYVADDHADKVAWLHAEGMLKKNSLEQEIVSLQKEDAVVLYISCSNHPALATADVGLALWEPGTPPPLFSDLIAKPELKQAWWLLEGIDKSRSNADQSVQLSKIEAIGGLVLSLRQLDELSIRRIKQAANATTLAAMYNGIRNARALRHFPDHIRSDLTPWHAMSAEHVLKKLESGSEGLTEETAQLRMTPDKADALSAPEKFLQSWAEEMSSPLTPILAAGAGLSALTGAVADAMLISGVVVTNAMVGGYQRYRVEAALAALDQQESNLTQVIRDGKRRMIDSARLVTGDVIALQAGELVPADCRIIESKHLEVDESSLTGESLPVKKKAVPTFSPVIAERSSMLYDGTTIVQGACHAVIVARGTDTEARRSFAIQLEQAGKTGVEARLEELTNRVAPIAALSGVAVLIAGLARHQPTHQLISTAVSLTVAAVPEGLPILSTMAQLASAQRLSKEGVLVRNPRSIEALGRIDVLCADKTGTLTEGRLSLVMVSDGERERPVDQLDDALKQILIAGLRGSPNGYKDRKLPHLTDQALFDGAQKAGITQFSDLGDWKRIYEKMFKSERGFHAVLGETKQKKVIFIKGAPDRLVPLCRYRQINGTLQELDDADRKRIEQVGHNLANAGLRILMVAQKPFAENALRFENEQIVDIIFLGFLALADPVRSTARQAVETLEQTGVEVIMITGDHPVTARSIAYQLGLKNPQGVITGIRLDQMDDDELIEALPLTSVFARVTPTQKARIVKMLKRMERIVAMTGDGANDAAAIRLADVGIALGEKSTPAARAAADLLVANEHIETIVHAVLEGRALWGSVKDAVSLMVGGNLGEIGFTLLGGLLDGRSPLNARQLLLVNLLTDSLPALAVALRRPKQLDPGSLLKEGPEQSLGQALTEDIQWRAITTGGAAALAWMLSRTAGTPQQASTVALLALVGGQLGQTLAAGRGSPLVIGAGVGSLAVLTGIVQTPGLSHFFGCRPLGMTGLSQAALATLLSTAGSNLLPKIDKQIRRVMKEDFQFRMRGVNAKKIYGNNAAN